MLTKDSDCQHLVAGSWIKCLNILNDAQLKAYCALLVILAIPYWATLELQEFHEEIK